jgi:hypothetical protein
MTRTRGPRASNGWGTAPVGAFPARGRNLLAVSDPLLAGGLRGPDEGGGPT